MTKEPKEKPKVNFHVPTGSKVRLKGFTSMSVDQNVTVVVKGKVVSVEDSAEVWNPGKRFSLELDSVKIIQPEQKVTIEEALKAAKQKV